MQLTVNLRPRANTMVDVAQCSRVPPSMRFWPAHFPVAGCGVRMLLNLRKVLKAPPVSRWSPGVDLRASGSMDCRLGAQTVSRDRIDGIPTFAISLKDNFVDVTSALD